MCCIWFTIYHGLYAVPVTQMLWHLMYFYWNIVNSYPTQCISAMYASMYTYIHILNITYIVMLQKEQWVICRYYKFYSININEKSTHKTKVATKVVVAAMDSVPYATDAMGCTVRKIAEYQLNITQYPIYFYCKYCLWHLQEQRCEQQQQRH